MKITERKSGTYTVLDVSGRLTINDNTEQIKESVLQLIQSGVTRIAIGLQQVSYMDSTGSAALIQCFQKARQKDLSIKYLNPSPPVRKLFEITKLDTILDIDDEAKL